MSFSAIDSAIPNSVMGGDSRYKLLETAIKRHQSQSDALIEVLHAAQEIFGYLDTDLLVHISKNLKLPLSKVYGVATFYHFFSVSPRGAHTCVICMGTACYTKGARKLAAAAEKISGLKVGETASDGSLSLMTARCIGACGIAPAIVLDGKVVGGQSEEMVTEQLKGWIEDGF